MDVTANRIITNHGHIILMESVKRLELERMAQQDLKYLIKKEEHQKFTSS